MAPKTDLERRFEAITVGPELAGNMEAIRQEAYSLAENVERLVPESRERSLAITKIEEAVFWANRGIARSG